MDLFGGEASGSINRVFLDEFDEWKPDAPPIVSMFVGLERQYFGPWCDGDLPVPCHPIPSHLQVFRIEPGSIP